nr:uncharacterized protein LOC121115901 [Lepeophtheirus salmonis]
MFANLVSKVLFRSFYCHLCGGIVMPVEGLEGEPDWYRHRLTCILNNYTIYCKLRQTPVPCYICRKKLRLWDLYEEFPFTCKRRSCSGFEKPMANTGYNRYTCFACDYDLCFTCYSKEVPARVSYSSDEYLESD